VFDWRDVARLVLEALEREEPALVERLARPEDGLLSHGRPWPATARRLQLTRAGERELARLRGYDIDAEDDTATTSWTEPRQAGAWHAVRSPSSQRRNSPA
jgi:hypothetical protein